MPVGLRSRVPAKMTSSILMPRRDLADCSPRTQVMASEMLDLPQPFGPTMAAMPSPESWTSVRSQKDLKPSIWTFFSLSKCDLFGRRIEENSPYWYDCYNFSCDPKRNQREQHHQLWIRRT